MDLMEARRQSHKLRKSGLHDVVIKDGGTRFDDPADVARNEIDLDAVLAQNTAPSPTPMEKEISVLSAPVNRRDPAIVANNREQLGSVGRAVAGGVQDFGLTTVSLAEDISEFVDGTTLGKGLGFIIPGLRNFNYAREQMPDGMRMEDAIEQGLESIGLRVPEGDGTVESLARGLVQFGAGMAAAPVKGVGYLKMMLRGGFADAMFDPEDGNISTLLRELGLDNAVLEYMDSAVDEDADAAERLKARLINSFEGGIASGIIDVAVTGLRIAKSNKGFRNLIREKLTSMGESAEGRMAARDDKNTLNSGMDPTLITDPLFAYIGKRVGNPGNEAAITRISEISQGKKAKVEDLATYFDEEHINIHGRKLDPYVEEDFDTAARAATNELKYQMEEAVSGQGWYDGDVKKTFEGLSKVPGLERLADNETLRVIWSAFSAPTSIGMKVKMNTRASTAAFLQFLKTGKVPTEPPLAGAVTEGISGAGWGRKQRSVASGMKVISHLIDTLGEEGFADWWLSPHTLKELTDVRIAAGLKGGPSGLSGGKNSIHLGAMALGDKTGRFSLNINGYQGTTKDMWFSRSYNRHFGNMKNPDGKVAGGPRNNQERRRMEEFTSRMLDNLKEEGLSDQDAQAILWFYEQNLFTDLGVTSRPGSFSEAAETISNDLRPGVRTSDEAEIRLEPEGEGEEILSDFRSISGSQRAVRSNRRGEQANGEAPTPYAREGGEGLGGDGLLVLTPDESTQRIYSEAGLSLPRISEVAATASAPQYSSDMASAMSTHKFGAQVELKSAEELSGARLFRTENGSGFAIKPDGDIVSVFQSGNETGKVGMSMMQAAIEAGGTKLDAFDTFLSGMYETVGFRPVARLPWSDANAPKGWDKNTFKKFNNGEPDVIFYVYDPDYFGDATDIPLFQNYDDAVSAQNAELSRLAPSVEGL